MVPTREGMGQGPDLGSYPPGYLQQRYDRIFGKVKPELRTAVRPLARLKYRCIRRSNLKAVLLKQSYRKSGKAVPATAAPRTTPARACAGV
jgi:hypothetical protein